jgi:hypothetical protein
MSLGTILIIVLILVLIGVIPTWGHSRAWGYGPSGLIGVVLVIVLNIVFAGKDLGTAGHSPSPTFDQRVTA